MGDESSAVGFATVFNGGDADGVFVFVEAHTVVADAQTELRRFEVLQALHIPFAGFQVAGQRVQDAESGGLIDGTELSLA